MSAPVGPILGTDTKKPESPEWDGLLVYGNFDAYLIRGKEYEPCTVSFLESENLLDFLDGQWRCHCLILAID